MLRSLKNLTKTWLYRKIGISYNPYGVPFALGQHLIGKSDLIMVDIGAYEGGITAAVDRMCGLERGVLVEPQPDRAAVLAAAFPKPRFTVVNKAVCDRVGEMDLDINVDEATTSILKVVKDAPALASVDVSRRCSVRCQTTTLDDLAREEGLARVDLMKLDVQGAEHLVFRGGIKTLSVTGLIWVEVSFVRLYEGAVLFPELDAQLRDQGFYLAELQESFKSTMGELVQADALYVHR